MGDIAVWSVRDEKPHRMPRAGVELERNLEDWIEADPTLLADGLRIVARQFHLDGGPLDLLGIDTQERWVVVELKRDRLHRETLTQAIDYASSIGLMPGGQLREKLQPYITGNPDLTDLVDRTLDEEGEGPRQVAIVLAGTRVDPHLERMAEFLAKHNGFQLAIVTFDVYRSERETVLMREVLEEEAPPADSSRRALSLEAIVEKAEQAGVGEQFRRAVALSEASGLYVRPYVRGVMIAPPQHHNRALLWFRPIPGGFMNVYQSPDGFAEFFPPVTVAEVEAVLGEERGGQFDEPALTERLDIIERLLSTLPKPS